MSTAWIEVRAGERARRHIAQQGLAPADIACIPAAAGGPKGLVLMPFDRLLLGEWLPPAAQIEFVGASIGAWRMAALAQADPLAALDRLQHAYVHEQNYGQSPTPKQVAAVCRGLARSVLANGGLRIRAGASLSVLTARAQRGLQSRGRGAFARAALANAAGRRHLASHLRRVVFAAGTASQFRTPFDAFGLERIALSAANTEDALLASGSIPIVCDPVSDIAGAPPGDYWDGGLIDYHLLLPYADLERLVLYPHFVPWVTPGWLDKYLPWRARPRGHDWLSNVLLIAPSRAMLERLPKGKLPDRNDFYRYGTDHAARIRAWEQAVAEAQRFADAAMAWLQSPDPSKVQPL
ncbi:MAG TPA: patatin-like phospholipase family protein [Burkholderiaceae bacterium]|nr:patatin-like phospholipase family protein [Burkholderiaceae bacterium]HQR76988.1 patatin-like phospholipase family protein [Burkholderiaceae bacterium]